VRRNFSRAWLVSRRELRDQLRDWRILFPMVVLSIFFPYVVNILGRVAINFANQYDAVVNTDGLIPFFLLIVGFFPMTISLVVALESFVGEKERGTIEPLLSSPLADWHLYVGKLMAGVALPLIASFLGISVYLWGVSRRGIPLPDSALLAQLFILTFVQSIMMVSGAIIISTQSTTVRAANLLASFVILPVAVLIQLESFVVLRGDTRQLWLAVAGVSIITVILIRLGLAHFQRESLIGREIDVLNVRWMGRQFAMGFRGQATSVWTWYRHELPRTLRRLGPSLAVTVVVGLVAIAMTYGWVQTQSGWIHAAVEKAGLSQALRGLGNTLNISGLHLSAGMILLNNIRALLVAFLLSLVSFSVLGVLAYLVNMVLIGGLLGVLNVMGISPLGVFAAGILPHGIFELTAVVLASAALLNLGVKLVTPDPEYSFGEVFFQAAADWAKIFIGISLPLLVVAAMIEANLTAHLLVSFLK
jgi:uncharacterized membrane protein SpoIIM required for sporulation/ABC-type transport system involved in multi-copper enzyme maturation permease subunit